MGKKRVVQRTRALRSSHSSVCASVAYLIKRLRCALSALPDSSQLHTWEQLISALQTHTIATRNSSNSSIDQRLQALQKQTVILFELLQLKTRTKALTVHACF